MSENPTPEESLADEFKNLGKNLSDLLQTAWDNPERKRVQDEIESGLNELGSTLKREAETFAESPTAQRLKADVEGLNERIRSADAREKMRKEMLGILQTANTELQKVIDKWSGPKTEEPPGDDSAEVKDETE